MDVLTGTLNLFRVYLGPTRLFIGVTPVLQPAQLQHPVRFSLHVELQTVELASQVIDLLQKVNVLNHYSRVLRLLRFLILREIESQVLQVLFEMLSPSREVLNNTLVIFLVLGVLLLHVNFVELDHVALKLFVVTDIMEALEDVVLKLLHVALLAEDLLADIVRLLQKSIEAHAKIFFNQLEVGTDTSEMLHFLVHFRVLLMEFLGVQFTRCNLLLHFLYLVIEHELEFLQVHGLVAQNADALQLLGQRQLSFFNLLVLTVDLLVKRLDVGQLIVQVVLHLLDGILLEVPLRLQIFIVVHNQSKFTLLLHRLINLFSHFLLIGLLLLVDSVPRFVFHTLPGLLELLHHLFDLLRETGFLCLKLVMLPLVLLLHGLHLLVLREIQLGRTLLEFIGLLFHLSLELHLPGMVRLNLLILIRNKPFHVCRMFLFHLLEHFVVAFDALFCLLLQLLQLVGVLFALEGHCLALLFDHFQLAEFLLLKFEHLVLLLLSNTGFQRLNFRLFLV